MTLNARQLQATRDELLANLDLSGQTQAQVAHGSGLAPARVEAVFAMSPMADPRDVWAIRDYLVAAIEKQGRTPRPFTALSETNREAARGWFGID